MTTVEQFKLAEGIVTLSSIVGGISALAMSLSAIIWIVHKVIRIPCDKAFLTKLFFSGMASLILSVVATALGAGGMAWYFLLIVFGG